MYPQNHRPIDFLELARHFSHVFVNEFERRTIVKKVDFMGVSLVRLKNSKGEMERAKFWKMYDSYYCYSFMANK